MARPISWLLSPIPILKLCQAVCLLLVIVFFIDGRIQWKAYSLIYFVAFVLAFGCILTLILHYVDVAKTSKQLPWIKLEILWNAVACALCIVSCIVLTWDWWQIRVGRHQHHSTMAPRNIGEARWLRRVAIVAASLLMAACLFLCTLVRVRRSGLN